MASRHHRVAFRRFAHHLSSAAVRREKIHSPFFLTFPPSVHDRRSFANNVAVTDACRKSPIRVPSCSSLFPPFLFPALFLRFLSFFFFSFFFFFFQYCQGGISHGDRTRGGIRSDLHLELKGFRFVGFSSGDRPARLVSARSYWPFICMPDGTRGLTPECSIFPVFEIIKSHERYFLEL